MQTIHATTSHLARQKENLVDLTEYRRWHGMPESTSAPEQETRPVRRRVRVGMALDWAASAALILTALTFVLKIL